MNNLAISTRQMKTCQLGLKASPYFTMVTVSVALRQKTASHLCLCNWETFESRELLFHCNIPIFQWNSKEAHAQTQCNMSFRLNTVSVRRIAPMYCRIKCVIVVTLNTKFNFVSVWMTVLLLLHKMVYTLSSARRSQKLKASESSRKSARLWC